jgi:hypothetical protein
MSRSAVRSEVVPIAVGVAVAMAVAGGCTAIVGVTDLPFAHDADAAGSSDSPTSDSVSSADAMDASGAEADAHIEGGGGGGGDGGQGGDGGTTGCPVGAFFCDGFESGSFDTSAWSGGGCSTMGTSYTVDRNAPHRGSFSLHMSFPQAIADSPLCIQVQSHQSFPSTPLYVRAWVATSALPNGIAGQGPLWAIDNASRTAGIGFDTADHYESFVTTSGSANRQTSTAVVPTGVPLVWTCLETEIDTSDAGGPDGSLSVWLDGSSTPDPVLTSVAPLPNGDGLLAVLGLIGEGPYPAFDAYFDDVAIGPQFIDCNE